MSRAAVLMSVLLATVLPARAAAARRAGVPVQELAPPGLRLTSVTAPLAPGLPARLVFGKGLLVDVAVAADEAGAARALARMLRGYSGDPGPRSAAFALDNVAILVRCLDAACDPRAHAERARRAVDRAPPGSPTVAPPRAHEGEITLPSWILAGRVVARGPATVEKLGDRKYLVTRTGHGPIEVDVVGIDVRLRPTSR